MARQIGKRPSSSGTGGSGRDPVIGLMTSPRAVRRKPVTVPPTATPRTHRRAAHRQGKERLPMARITRTSATLVK